MFATGLRAADQRIERHRADEPCPKEVCTCGFYAFKTREQAVEEDGWAVLARVALWGKVIVHQRGYRAARMRIEELFIVQGHDPAVVAALMDRYPVPLHFVEKPKWTSDYQSAPSTLNPSLFQSRMYYQPSQPNQPIQYQPLHLPALPSASPLWRWLTVPGGHQPKQAAQFIKQLTDAEVQQLVSELRERSERAERGQP
jgi:hypothetical protein